jgi:hypothetical protein
MATYKAKSPRSVRQSHPLIGKLLRWNSEDLEYYTVSRFIADLGGGYLLARRINPRTGADFGDLHIVSLEAIAQPDMAGIYDDWDTLQREWESPHHEDRVIKLVPKE